MLAKLYKAIWSRFGGKPWTIILRESYHKYPLLWIVGLGWFATWVGIVIGHIWW